MSGRSSHLLLSNPIHPHLLDPSPLSPFIITPYHPSITPRFAPSTTPSSPTPSARGRCTPSIPFDAAVDPTANAPPPFVRLLRPASLQLGEGEGEVAVRREAGWLEEDEWVRRVEEEELVVEYRARVKERVRQRERRRRKEEEERTRSLPLAMQQLVYGSAGGQAECRQPGREKAKELLSGDNRPLLVDDLRVSGRSESHEVERQRHALLFGRPSRAEAASYQRRIHRLAGLRERQEALRVKTALAAQRQRRRRQPPVESEPPPEVESQPSPPSPTPAPPVHRAPRLRASARFTPWASVSVPASPRQCPSSSLQLPVVWDELQRRLLRLDVAIGPLCACSAGGGQGVGRGLVHASSCQWQGREVDYAQALLGWCEELERARGEEAVQRLQEQLNRHSSGG